ncbi:MAG: hypothetical protein OXU77_04470 [Gammaproteobacteria bacterium]|nr:hypothetical protein [Gammaproteobacteria bacterium]
MDNQRRRRPSVHRSDAGTLDPGKVEVLENELRALGELEAPGELWERIQGRLDEDGHVQSPSPGRWSRQTPLVAAASVALVAVAAVLVWVHVSTGDIETAGDGLTQRGDESSDHHALIAALMEQSRQTEERRRTVLAFYSPSAPERLLRTQISGIDAALNELFADDIEPKSREALLRDRIDLMADLTDIERYRQHEFVRQVSF